MSAARAWRHSYCGSRFSRFLFRITVRSRLAQRDKDTARPLATEHEAGAVALDDAHAHDERNRVLLRMDFGRPPAFRHARAECKMTADSTIAARRSFHMNTGVGTKNSCVRFENGHQRGRDVRRADFRRRRTVAERPRACGDSVADELGDTDSKMCLATKDLRRRTLEASQSNAAWVSKRVANIAWCVADDRMCCRLRTYRAEPDRFDRLLHRVPGRHVDGLFRAPIVATDWQSLKIGVRPLFR